MPKSINLYDAPENCAAPFGSADAPSHRIGHALRAQLMINVKRSNQERHCQ